MTLGERVKAAAAEIGLSDEQRKKLEALAEEVTKRADALHAGRGAEMRRELAELRERTVERVKGLLSEEQFVKFQEAMAGGGRSAGARLGVALQRFQEAAKGLELTGEQKEQVRSAFEAARKALDEVRPQLQGGQASAEVREKVRGAVEEMRAKVQEVLTAEQREKLDELMRRPGPGRPEREGPKRDE
jgi:Spy/CpxP family protein refolding chaperone